MSETIALGGSRFELRPLKLGQLRDVVDALDAMAAAAGGGLIAAAAKVVAAGLQPAHPGLAADTLLDLEAGVAELNAAVAAVLRIAGLQPRDAVPGEAQPVARATAPLPDNSAPSTAPSPPAAAIPSASSTA